MLVNPTLRHDLKSLDAHSGATGLSRPPGPQSPTVPSRSPQWPMRRHSPSGVFHAVLGSSKVSLATGPTELQLRSSGSERSVGRATANAKPYLQPGSVPDGGSKSHTPG
eukprot:2926744-Prymnesium_polylepis.1